jgi:hypothetical protein
MRNAITSRFTAIARLLTLLGLVVVLAACGTDGSDAAAGETVTSTVATTEPAEDDDHDHDHDDTDHEPAADEGDDDQGALELDTARRLLTVAALNEPRLELIDLDDLSSTSIELPAPASLGSSLSEDRRFLFTAHEGAVGVVDTGVWSEPHGDHFHHYSSPAALLGAVDGPNPSHLVSHDRVTAHYFDGTGEAVLIDEDSLTDGEIVELGRVVTGEPHHGFAVPAAGHYVVTVPTEDMEQLPNAIGVSEAEGAIIETYDCPLAHGESGLPGGAAAACGDGVLVVSSDAGTWTGTHLSYPEVADEDPYGYGAARAWTLFPSADHDLLAAPYGARHLLTVDPVALTLTAFDVALDVATLGVGVHQSGALVVLTLDGEVFLVDPEDGSVLSSVEAVTPFEEGDPNEPYRLLVVSGDRAYVSDPATDSVVEVSLGDVVAVERTIDLPFTPSHIAVANG